MDAEDEPRGRLHCVTRYDEDGDPYRKVCQCAATDGKNHDRMPATHTIAARDLQMGDQLDYDAAQDILSGAHAPASLVGTDVQVVTVDREDDGVAVRFHADDEPEFVRGDLQVTVTRPWVSSAPAASADEER